jgi:hypothetical protein
MTMRIGAFIRRPLPWDADCCGRRAGGSRDLEREVIGAVEVREPLSRGFKAESETGPLLVLACRRVAAVAHGQREVFAFALCRDRHQARSAVPFDAVPDSVLDERLQHQRRDERLSELRIQPHFGGQPIIEAQPLDPQIVLGPRDFLLQRNPRIAVGREHDAQEIAERDQRSERLLRVREPDESSDGVQRVEQEMRLQPARQRFEPRLREAPLELGGANAIRRQRACVADCVTGAGHGRVAEHVDERLIVQLAEQRFVRDAEGCVEHEVQQHVADAERKRPGCVNSQAAPARRALERQSLADRDDERRNRAPQHHGPQERVQLVPLQPRGLRSDHDEIAREHEERQRQPGGAARNPDGSRFQQGRHGEALSLTIAPWMQASQ